MRVLNDGTAYVGDREAILANAREAADISQNRLGSPQAALGALERAVALAPADTALRSQYADALSAAGEVGKAREILEGLIKDSGRRRSKERATLHHRLASVARAENKRQGGAGPPGAGGRHGHGQRRRGGGAGRGGRAERRGRSGRERLPGAGAAAAAGAASRRPLTTTLVLLRLRKMALARGQEDKAQDLLDSAITDAIASPDEARRLTDALRAEGARDVLRTVLDRRLAAAGEPEQQAAILADAGELEASEGQVGRGPGVAAVGAGEGARGAGDPPGRAPGGAQAGRARPKRGRPAGRRRWRRWPSERRAAEDAALHAALLSEAGEIALDDLQDPARAADLWGRAAQVGAEGGPAAVDAAYRMVRLAQLRRSDADRTKALRSLTRLGKAGVPDALRIEALFRLAEVQMGADDTREQGLAAVASALELSGDVERAFSLVRSANVPDSELPRVLPLYEKVARASKDERMLLDFLERKAALPSATFVEVREGVELALGSARAVPRRDAAAPGGGAGAGGRRRSQGAGVGAAGAGRGPPLGRGHRRRGGLPGRGARRRRSRARAAPVPGNRPPGAGGAAAIPPSPPRCTSGCGSASPPTAAPGSR